MKSPKHVRQWLKNPVVVCEICTFCWLRLIKSPTFSWFNPFFMHVETHIYAHCGSIANFCWSHLPFLTFDFIMDELLDCWLVEFSSQTLQTGLSLFGEQSMPGPLNWGWRPMKSPSVDLSGWADTKSCEGLGTRKTIPICSMYSIFTYKTGWFMG